MGLPLDDDGSTDRGSVGIIFLNRDGTAKGSNQISDTDLSLLSNSDYFGEHIEGVGDWNKDGIPDVAVSTHTSDE